jgi:undecaprenyl diphosphate synthase
VHPTATTPTNRATTATPATSATPDQADAGSPVQVVRHPSLRHVLVVGGTLHAWSTLAPEAWDRRVESLGGLCSALGVPWLTLRAYEPGSESPDDDLTLWRRVVGTCEVIIDPCGDGRQRFADAMQRLEPTDEVNEATVAGVLYDPADCEPDLVVVLGPPTQLPPSLVWELAYAELVFIPVEWGDLTVDDLAGAINDFSNRRRRFGGLDE